MFPTLFQKVREILENEKIVVVTGKVSDKDGVPKVLADDIKDVMAMQNQVAQSREQEAQAKSKPNPTLPRPKPSLRP